MLILPIVVLEIWAFGMSGDGKDLIQLSSHGVLIAEHLQISVNLDIFLYFNPKCCFDNVYVPSHVEFPNIAHQQTTDAINGPLHLAIRSGNPHWPPSGQIVNY